MTSGKQTKRRRAQAPPVRSAARQRQASPRVLLAAGAALALVVAAVVLGLALSGGDDPAADVPARGSLENALPGADEVEAMLEGIPQDGNVLGSPDAPATLVEYVDFQCPFCQQFETQALPTLIERYVRTGKAKIELRPIAFIGPDSAEARAAVVAAGHQDRLFNMADLLYLNQGAENSGWVTDDLIAAAAASIPGLDVPRLLDEIDSSETEEQLGSFDELAQRDGIRSTPTVLVGRSGQTLRQVDLAAATDVESIAAALDAAAG